ncbi:MAG: aldo/keto reductase [Oscillospiraceae bacterium]|nr:aldo/keto reductase [Oscillospiraceae bacterium]
MNYRTLGKTGIKVSEIGLGSEGFVGCDKNATNRLIEAALESGINYFDLYNPEPYVRSNLGEAMRGRRDKFVIQGHICSAWLDGQYKRTRDMEQVRAACDDLFERLETDYIDVGMIHYVDEQSDYDKVFGGEVIEFMKKLKADGKILHIGMSTHNPKVAIQAVKTGLIEVLMLSVNPAYDMLPPNEDVNVLFEEETFASDVLSNIDPEREELYRLCEFTGTAITVMKPYAGGALLNEKTSPFGVKLTVPQCLHYCLTRPAAVSVLAGAKTVDELKEAAAYSGLPESEKEYASVLAGAPAHSFSDKCMYCGHCAPCTKGIDIASVNKFADLCEVQETVPETVREHYEALSAKASDCIACGKCEKNCPFGVKIIEHMKKAVGIFGK